VNSKTNCLLLLQASGLSLRPQAQSKEESPQSQS
jgi:hypothetical protein